MSQPSERITKFNLLGGEDTYASQTAQNPQTARRLSGLIPSFAGYLEREKAHAKFTISPGNTPAAALPAGATWLFQADFADPASGQNHRYFLAATASNVYVLTTSAGVDSWTVLITGLSGVPQGVILANKLFISDGVSSWTVIPNVGFATLSVVTEGFVIPTHAPAFTSTAGAGGVSITAISRTNGVTTMTCSGSIGGPVVQTQAVVAGLTGDVTFNGQYLMTPTGFTNQYSYPQPGLPDSVDSSGTGTATQAVPTILSTRYYWSTFVDETGELSGPSRVHESSSSPRSLGTGANSTNYFSVTQRPGSIGYSSSSTALTGVGTDFDQNDVGMTVFSKINTSFPAQYGAIGVIATVTDSQHATLVANGPINNSTAPFVIAPARTTNINIYASEAESSNIGYLLGSFPTTFVKSTFNVIYTVYDQAQFNGGTNSPFNGNTTQRPYRSDPPVPSLISTAHKRRNFHRRETRPNFFLFSAYEEVLQFGTFCAPDESYPGTAKDTISDIINETSFPDQSRAVRNIVSHGDALFLFSEKNCYALYGESIDDFSLSQATAFSVGCAGRNAAISTPHGLAFVTYDGKVMLYPTQFVFWAILGDATSALIELSRPKRVDFEQMDLTTPDSIKLNFHYFGRRNWLVFTFKLKNSSSYQTWIYDFEIQGWFQLSVGLVTTAIFEPSDGYKILVGVDTSGNTLVIDDVTGTYASASAQPSGLYRPALIDFGRPDMNHILKFVEFEVSNPSMNVSVNWYRDPLDASNPTPALALPFNVTALRIGVGKFRCYPKYPGTLCNRALLEFNVASDTNDGQIRSISLYAEPASSIIG